MAIVLAAVGTLLYVRLGDALAEQLDEGLGLRAQALASDGTLATGDDEAVAQRLGHDGAPTESSPGLGEPLVTPEEVTRAQDEAFFVTREVNGQAMRLLVTPAVVVGASLEDREEALDELLAQLLVVGPLALLLASAAGYALATAALRPVEAMRSEAAEISGDAAGQRLPLPRARDE